MDKDIKVSQGDGSRQFVDIKSVKPINNIKVIRPQESEYTDSDDMSSVSEESAPKKRTKKILRKKENRYPEPKNYGAFSNPKKVSQREQNDSESEYSSEESYASDESGKSNGQNANDVFEEKQKLKQDLLIKIQALEKKGFEFSKKFNMTSNYDDMELEYLKVKKHIETQAGIKFARRCLMACVTGIEFLNKKFDPFNVKLEGWSENVMESVDDYDNIFEKLHEKYSSKAEIAPEIELLLTLGGSAFMFHLTNSLLKGPAMGNMLAQNNPNFMSSMMGAMSQGMKEMSKPPNFQQVPQRGEPNASGSVGVSGTPFAPVETRGIRKEMRGPTMDPSLFNNTPLASNYPNPPKNYSNPPNVNLPNVNSQNVNLQNVNLQKNYSRQSNYDDDDRVSVVSTDSSDSSVSSVSVATVKKVQLKKNKGFELNIK